MSDIEIDNLVSEENERRRQEMLERATKIIRSIAHQQRQIDVLLEAIAHNRKELRDLTFVEVDVKDILGK